MKLGKRKLMPLIIALAVLALLSTPIIDYFHTSQNEILEDAIYIESYEESFFSKLKYLPDRIINLDFRQERTFPLMIPGATPQNLSESVLVRGWPRKKEFDFSFKNLTHYDTGYGEFIKRHWTLIRIKDITEQIWKWDGNKFSGSFSFENKHIKGRCLFQGKDYRITEMLIAKKGSDKLKEGFGVFGCIYGRNYFDDDRYSRNPLFDMRIHIPATEDGAYITYEQFNPNSLCLSILENGDIMGPELLNIKELEQQIKETQIRNTKRRKNNSPVCVYLKFDSRLQNKRKEEIIEIVKKYDLPAYQLFNTERHTILVKKIE